MAQRPEPGGGDRAALDRIVALGLSIAALGLYLVTLAPTVLGGDAGEFQFVPPLLGVAHPTGYPLYVLLGWLWTHLLPLGDVAWRMNLFSAVTAAAATGIFYLAALALMRQAAAARLGGPLAITSGPGVQRVVAAVAAASLAATPTLWSQAVIAEVYGLHTLLTVLLFYWLLRWGNQPAARWLNLAALVFGLGLAHHRTTLLLAPAAAAYVWLVDRGVFGRRRQLAQVALLVLLPQLLYLLIPLRAPHAPYLRQPLAPGREMVLYENTPANFFDFVMGGPFGGSLDLSVDLGQRLAMAAGLLRAELGWGGILLAAAGLIWLIFTRRAAPLALTGVAYVATVAFNLVYTIGDIYVLFVPSYVVAVLWITLGAWAAASLIAQAVQSLARRPIPLQRVALLTVLPLVWLPIWLVATYYGDVDRSGSTSARNGWSRLLSSPLPQGAVLVSDDRNEIMPLWYLQHVEGVRPDLLGLFPLITQQQPSLGDVVDLAIGTQRPVYLIKEMPGIEVKVDVSAEAGLWRVEGPALTGAPEYEVGATLGQMVTLVGYDRAPRSPQPGQALRVTLTWESVAPAQAAYQSYVHLVDAAGQRLAQSDHRPGDIFYPTTQWRPGEQLRDEHTLTVPEGTAPGVYRLMAGMYYLADDGAITTVGETVALGAVAVKMADAPAADAPAYATGVSLDELIELAGYDVDADADTLHVTLHWRALQAPASDYTIFVHLLDPGGEIVAQDDTPPVGGTYPTSVWDAGELVLDRHRLPLPPGVTAADLGHYQLRVGLYDPETGDRLAALTGEDQITLVLPNLP